MQDRGRIRLIEGFRRHAAALVVEQGQQLGEVAGRLGIDAQLLDRWIRAFTGGNTATEDSRSPPSTHGNSTAQARTETAQCKGRQP